MKIWEIDPQTRWYVLSHYLSVAKKNQETGAVEFLAEQLQRLEEENQ